MKQIDHSNRLTSPSYQLDMFSLRILRCLTENQESMDVVPFECLQLSEKFPGVFINQTTIKALALEDESCIFNFKRFQRSYGKTSINVLVIEVSAIPGIGRRSLTSSEECIYAGDRSH